MPDEPDEPVTLSPEKLAEIDAVLERARRREVRIQGEDVEMRGCVECGAEACEPVYVLLDHSSFEVGRRYSILGAISIQRSRLLPCVMPVCARCYDGVAANRRRRRISTMIAAAGLVVAGGYFVAALLMAPTVVSVSLLFGGGGVFAAGIAYALLTDRSLHARLHLPRLRAMSVLLVSKDKAELERTLDRYQLSSLELQNEIERKAIEASSLPAARTLPK